jgi:hypothetical protein
LAGILAGVIQEALVMVTCGVSGANSPDPPFEGNDSN